MMALRLALAAGLALGLGACVERGASGSRDLGALAAAVLESGQAPIEVELRHGRTADGRMMSEVFIRAAQGSERWFGRVGRELRLEAGSERPRLEARAGGLAARWGGGPATLTWIASDGSAGLRVELADLDRDPELAPRFEPLARTGLVEVAVPIGARP